jgi:tRNA (guanine26-N2/guanine27-N2)-dimethyltransferase
MWGGPLHSPEFVEKLQRTVEGMDETVYSTRPRMLGMLSLAAEVTPISKSDAPKELDVPFYRTPQELASRIKTQTPPLDTVWSALMNAGYKVSSTHCCASAFKTDAPNLVVWDIMKEWVSCPDGIADADKITSCQPGEIGRGATVDRRKDPCYSCYVIL